MVTLTPTKRIIQNSVIIGAMIFVFGVVGSAYVMPSMFYADDFQKSVADNSMILIVVIVSGSITALALNKRGDRTDELIKILLEKHHGIKLDGPPEED